MQVDAVERDAELRKGVERGFLGAPVEILAPVFGELAQIADIGAIGPGFARGLVGETRAGKAIAQVGDVGIRNMKREGGGFCHDPAHISCRRCALRTYMALSASSSALPASAWGPSTATPAEAPAITVRP